MKKIKWYGWAAAGVALLAIAAFLLFRPSSGSGTYDNLIENGTFEALDEDGLPSCWYTDAYFDWESTQYEAAAGLEGKGAHIVSTEANDARFAQEVPVSPDTLYRLHGYIKSDAKGGLGANLSIADVYVFSSCLYSTDGEWQEVSLYGRTGKSQRSVTVYARLGGYSGEATGEAWFDQITLCRVDQVPTGFTETQWYMTAAQQPSSEEAGVSSGMAGLIVGAVLYFGLFVLVFTLFLSKETGDQLSASPSHFFTWGAVLMLLLAFALRMVVAAHFPGYDVDITDFRIWAQSIASVGPGQFYQTGWCDYPPGYLLVLWPVGLLARLTGTEVTELMVKLPPMLADLALCVLLFAEGRKRLGDRAALGIALLYAFNPLVLVNSAAWGQADSVMALLLFLVLLFAMNGKWRWALPCYILAVLTKPQALMFGPLGLAAFVADIVKGCKQEDRKTAMLREVLWGLGFMVLFALAVVLPFSLHQSPDWLITLYGSTMGQYGYATVNACNLYFLLGKNWIGSQANISRDVLIPLIAYCLAVLPLVSAALMNDVRSQWADPKKRARIYCLGAPAVVLGAALLILGLLGRLTYSSLGTCMVGYAVALFILIYLMENSIKKLPMLGASMLLLLFSTGNMMHERYLFPAVVLLLLAYVVEKDRRILWLALIVTVSSLFNVGCVLHRNQVIGGAAGHLDAPAIGLSSESAPLEYLSAVLNCLAAALSVLICLLPPKAEEAEARSRLMDKASTRACPLPQQAPLRPMTKKDWAIMLTVTVLYAVLAFTNLGSTKAPQTAWVSSSPDEEIILDLGEEKQFNMLYYMGIHWLSDWQSPVIAVSTSTDGQNWSGYYEGCVRSGTTPQDTFDVFKWKYVSTSGATSYPVEMTGRYIRISAAFPELTLYEVILRDVDSGEVLPVQLLSDRIYSDESLDEDGQLLSAEDAAFPHGLYADAQNPTASCLIDEQDTLEGEPGWYNSTYFDEIYHARTAYEHLHGLPTYETTHPPLGKVLMGWAIAIFGMTPFGWRFAGALAGVLMLPGMYLLGKLLIRKKWGGLGASVLLALDLMHFTQTRIATIDSFVVLFIIWMVYFMLRWFFQDFYGKPFWKTLIPLGLSGLFMGLGIASKWTGCYAGAGLAVIFFWGIWRRWRQAAALRQAEARQIIETAEAEVAKAKEQRSGEKNRNAKAALAAAQQRLEDARQSTAAILSPWHDPRVRALLITICSCLIFFVALPLVIYYAAHIPYFASTPGGITVQKVIQAADGMLSYHSQPGLGMNHPFYSPWYQWPLIIKPMWYSSNAFEPFGYQSTIMAMGNPAVWWSGLLGLAGVAFLWLKRRYDEKNHALSLYPQADDPRYALLLICFAAQYLPWVPVPRGTYIYHYFPSVPFIILCVMLCLDTLSQKREKAARIVLWVLLAVAAVLFVGFFPYASGITASEGWLDAMRWFNNWLYY